jgi:hypothetical protein
LVTDTFCVLTSVIELVKKACEIGEERKKYFSKKD